MSLSEAVLAIADSMEHESQDMELSVEAICLLRSFARELRTAVRAAEGTAPGPFLDPGMQHVLGVQKAREEFKGKVAPIDGVVGREEEFLGNRMVEVVGMDDDATMTPIPHDMPPGARIAVAGVVCQLGEDGKLHVLDGAPPPEKKILVVGEN